MDPKEVAKRKILLQQKMLASKSTSGRRRRRTTSGNTNRQDLKKRESYDVVNATLPQSRRQSRPQIPLSTQSTTAQVKGQIPSENKGIAQNCTGTSTDTDRNTVGAMEKAQTDKRKQTKFVNATELPPLPAHIRRFSRKSSFPLRKKVDNELGYKVRERNRHSWQNARQQNFRDYFSSSSRDEYHDELSE